MDHFKLGRDDVHVEMGTFSKAFGVIGGHISGSEDLRNFAYNKSRSWLLSGAVPPGIAAACIAAIDVLETEAEHVRRLWENRNYLLDGFRDVGFDTGNSETPIIPVMCGKSKTSKDLADYLWTKGIFVLPIFFPMVARENARIRVQLCAKHTTEQLEKALEAFKKGARKLSMI